METGTSKDGSRYKPSSDRGVTYARVFLEIGKRGEGCLKSGQNTAEKLLLLKARVEPAMRDCAMAEEQEPLSDHIRKLRKRVTLPKSRKKRTTSHQTFRASCARTHSSLHGRVNRPCYVTRGGPRIKGSGSTLWSSVRVGENIM